MAEYYRIPTNVSTSIVVMSQGQFARWLLDQMRRRDWNQTDVAERVGTHSSVVSRWVRGERVPDTKSIDKIADVFGLPVDDVLTIAGHRPAVEPLDPDDPRELLAARVRRMRPDPSDLQLLNTILDNWDARNRKEREGT